MIIGMHKCEFPGCTSNAAMPVVVIGEQELGIRCIDHTPQGPHENPDMQDAQDECRHLYEWSRYCGARVCMICYEHNGLDRCYCGWSRSGGDGRRELVEMGETIEADDY